MSATDRLLAGVRNVNLASLALLGRRTAFVDYLRRANRAYSYLTLDPIEAVDLADIIGAGSPPDLFVPLDGIRSGSASVADLAALAAIARRKAPKRVFEIGTFQGLTTSLFARNGGPETHVFTLDLPQAQDAQTPRTERSYHEVYTGYRSGELVGRYGCGSQVTMLKGDSAIFDFTPYGDIDLFFVDGAHTSDYVAADTKSAFTSIAPDGWVVWHDVFMPEVLTVLKRIARYCPVQYIRETNLAITRQRPGAGFPWDVLSVSIR